jgi:hypothetical protein
MCLNEQQIFRSGYGWLPLPQALASREMAMRLPEPARSSRHWGGSMFCCGAALEPAVDHTLPGSLGAAMRKILRSAQ